MKRLEGRIRKIEDKLYGRKNYTGGMWVYIYNDCYSLPEPPPGIADKELWKRRLMEFLGPQDEWLTVKSQKEADEKAYEERCKHHPPDAIHIAQIDADPCAELKARKQQNPTIIDKIASLK